MKMSFLKFKNKNGGFTRIVDFKEVTSSRTKSASLKLTTGFTILEVMVAIAVFLIVVMSGMGALVNVSAVYKKSQHMRSIMDGLTFTMEEMSKNIRVGSSYYCNDTAQLTLTPPFNTQENCLAGNTKRLVFNKIDNDIPSTFVYQISGARVEKKVKSITDTDTNNTFIPLTPSEVEINDTSGFTVIGSDKNDTIQPLVIIKLSGVINGTQGEKTPFSLRTTVSQRLIDINIDTPQ